MPPVRFQVQIEIDTSTDLRDPLFYHGITLDEALLERLIATLVYENTNTYDSEIKVSALRIGGEHSSDAVR